MKKSDLKSGMLIKTGAGSWGIVMLGTPQGDSIVRGRDAEGVEYTWFPMENLSDDLTDDSRQLTYRVDEVYSYSSNQEACLPSIRERKLLWSRNQKHLYLNSEYTAELKESERKIKIGCQTMTYEKLKELYDLINLPESKRSPKREAFVVNTPNKDMYVFMIEYAGKKGVPVFSDTFDKRNSDSKYRQFPIVIFDGSEVCASISDGSDSVISIDAFIEFCDKYKNLIPPTIQLTDDYTGVVHYEKEVVVALEREYSFDLVKKLYKLTIQ
jgi:hypothetical protein